MCQFCPLPCWFDLSSLKSVKTHPFSSLYQYNPQFQLKVLDCIRSNMSFIMTSKSLNLNFFQMMNYQRKNFNLLRKSLIQFYSITTSEKQCLKIILLTFHHLDLYLRLEKTNIHFKVQLSANNTYIKENASFLLLDSTFP